jgi:hypothetical protein
MAPKDEDIFHLKMQWIACTDEAEKKKLAEKIRLALSLRQERSTNA